jgi:penicillin-binding protein 2
MNEVREGMIEVVNGANGTGHEAQLEGVEVAGKTGTAQWGPKNKERTAAWFSGFLPAENPKYAFAAVYEGDVGSKVHGGTTAAPMIADIFQEIYKRTKASNRNAREPTQQIRRAQPVEEDASD